MANLGQILFLFAHHVSAESITIQNAGFEIDFYPINNNTIEYIWQPTGWLRYNPQNMSLSSASTAIGVFNPAGGTSLNDPTFHDSAPEGIQCVTIDQWDDQNRDNGELGIFQLLSGNAVTANTTYTLSVWVGNDAPNTWSVEGYWDYTGFPGYKVQLIANDDMLSQDNNTLSVSDGRWEESIVRYIVLSGDLNIGKTLGIRLINKNIDNANQWGMAVNFDDVQLEAITFSPTSIPTLSPTPIPTQIPTLSPTRIPTLFLTSTPSKAHSYPPTTHSSLYPSYDSIEDNYPITNIYTEALVICAGIVFGLFWIFVCVYFYKQQKQFTQSGERDHEKSVMLWEYGEKDVVTPGHYVVHSLSQAEADNISNAPGIAIKEHPEPGSPPPDNMPITDYGVIEMALESLLSVPSPEASHSSEANIQKHTLSDIMRRVPQEIVKRASCSSSDSIYEPGDDVKSSDTRTEFGNEEATARFKEEQKVVLWMQTQVKLSEYTELLLFNGFDNTDSVTEITMEDLEAIGIEKLGHRRKIVKFAKQLKIELFLDSV